MPNGISGVIRKMTKTVVKSSIDIEIKSIKLTSVDLHITFCSTKQIFFFKVTLVPFWPLSASISISKLRVK